MDTWVWLVWRIESGPLTGTYAIGTFNHDWSDFDSPPVDLTFAEANRQETMLPYAESVRVGESAHPRSRHATFCDGQTAFAISAICSTSVPQQPPTTRRP